MISRNLLETKVLREWQPLRGDKNVLNGTRPDYTGRENIGFKLWQKLKRLCQYWKVP